MSLVVAEITASGPYIVSDTRVSFADLTNPSIRSGTLKAIVVNATTAICFAGDRMIGLAAVRDFERGIASGSDRGQLVSDLAARSANGSDSADFIIAESGTAPRLTRIREGIVEQDLPVTWIGDQLGFERFQEERAFQTSQLGFDSAGLRSDPAVLQSLLGRCMDAVIDDPGVPSVGEINVRICARRRDRALVYLEEAVLQINRDLPMKTGDNVGRRMAQPTSEGGYAAVVVPPMNPGTPALGLCFPIAHVGIMFLPLEFDSGQVILDVEPDAFSRVVFERFGVALTDPIRPWETGWPPIIWRGPEGG
jgi:hypothetical protein